ncbi:MULTISPECIES: hypothetical protein [unclassified Mycobacterium]|uniref:hypothetical protein n=1 Tax=unclassified Mycobacterium TaxID=2642494 RepID=UPI001E5224ED|nr:MULTISPECIES: hypothetical protein [unclassified Mycobacterium]
MLSPLFFLRSRHSIRGGTGPVSSSFEPTVERGAAVLTKPISAVAVVAAIAAAALTLLPWIDLDHLGLPLRWNGLGVYIGEHGEHYGAHLAGMANSAPGWTIVIASLAAAAAMVGATRVNVLGLVACGFAVVAFVTALLCLVRPGVLAGDTKHELGISELPDREVLNSAALVAEVAATGVLVVATSLAAMEARRVRAAAD